MRPNVPILTVERVKKQYTMGWLPRRITFSLQADMAFEVPAITRKRNGK